MTEIKLSVLDRAVFNELLPKNGKIVEMLMAKNLTSLVEFTAKEIEAFGIKDAQNGGINWDKTKIKDVSFNFENSEIEFLKKGADLLDSGGQVTAYTLELVLKVQNAKPIQTK